MSKQVHIITILKPSSSSLDKIFNIFIKYILLFRKLQNHVLIFFPSGQFSVVYLLTSPENCQYCIILTISCPFPFLKSCIKESIIWVSGFLFLIGIGSHFVQKMDHPFLRGESSSRTGVFKRRSDAITRGSVYQRAAALVDLVYFFFWFLLLLLIVVVCWQILLISVIDFMMRLLIFCFGMLGNCGRIWEWGSTMFGISIKRGFVGILDRLLDMEWDFLSPGFRTF